MSNERGFSLIEIVVATVVFAVVVVVIGSYFPTAALSGRIGRNVTIAASLAQQKVEQVRAQGFSYVAAGNADGTESIDQGGVTFTRTTTTCVPPSSSSGSCGSLPAECAGGAGVSDSKLAKVCVQVTWTDQGFTAARTVTDVIFLQGYY